MQSRREARPDSASNVPTGDGTPSYLLHLLKEEWRNLQVHLLTVLLDGSIENLIVWFWQRNTREEIRGDTVEQRQIVVKELGKVDIDDGSQHENVFFFIRVLQLKKQMPP